MTQAVTEEKIPVSHDGQSHTVRFPVSYPLRGDEVYVRRDPKTGVISLSEKPFRPTAEEIFRAFDEAGLEAFELDRDLSPSVDRDLF